MADPHDTAVAERLARIESSLTTLLDQTAHIARISDNLARMQERSDQHHSSIDVLFDKISKVEDKERETDSKVDKWINRGVGAYMAASILIGVIAFLLFRVIGEYEGRIRNAGDMLVTIDRRLAWIEFEQRDKQRKDGGEKWTHSTKPSSD